MLLLLSLFLFLLIFIRQGRRATAVIAITKRPETQQQQQQKSCACPPFVPFFFLFSRSRPVVSFEEVARSDYKERGDGYKGKRIKRNSRRELGGTGDEGGGGFMAAVGSFNRQQQQQQHINPPCSTLYGAIRRKRDEIRRPGFYPWQQPSPHVRTRQTTQRKRERESEGSIQHTISQSRKKRKKEKREKSTGGRYLGDWRFPRWTKLQSFWSSCVIGRNY